LDETLIKTLTQVGTTGGALLVVAYFVGKGLMRVFDRLIASIDKVSTKLDDHTTAENEHHTLVREELANMRGHLGIPTPVHGVPITVERQPSSPVRTTVRAKSEPGR
jgi:hypothetical protein